MPQTLSRPEPKVRHRLSWEKRLQLLDPRVPTKLTEWRLRQFMKLFAPRFTDAIITRARGGARDWTKLKGRIYLDHIVRHLLADLRPGLPPQWIGARSFEESEFVCIDVDCDRDAASPLIEQPVLTPIEMRRLLQGAATSVCLSFNNRCRLLEFVLQQLGIDANEKKQVLIQQTPSGGRHYYMFFNQKEDLSNLRSIFESVGLRFSKGQFEFFPSTNQGLRLPFGHVPGQPHNPRRWIRFVEAYRRGQIIRHDLEQLQQRALLQSSWANISALPPAPAPTPSAPKSKPIRSGLPRSLQTPSSPISRDASFDLKTPIQNTAEIDAIWSHGITQHGTRNAILKMLVAHLIYVRGLSAKAAEDRLIAWAMNPRHCSYDIARDLQQGTDIVANEIQRMCRCYEQHRDPTRRILSQPCFTQSEVQFIARHLEQTNPHNAATYATFLLHFLRFAKQHGSYDADLQAWVSQPAVSAVIRKWPGCRAEQSKLLPEQAMKLGILKLLKGSWHNPKGKGQARTYLLFIPSAFDQLAVATLEQAEKQLLDLRISLSSNQTVAHAAESATNKIGTRTGEDHDYQHPSFPISTSGSATYPTSTVVPETCARNALEPGPRPGPFAPDVDAGLHRRDPPDVSRTSTPQRSGVPGDFSQGRLGTNLSTTMIVSTTLQRLLSHDRGTSIAHIRYSAGAIDMAHELATTNGRPAICYFGESPWHRLGTKLDNPATAGEAIAAAGLDYTVEKQPLFTADGEEARQRQAVVRSDTREVLGVVGRGYMPIQNAQAFSFLDILAQSRELRYHTAGALGRGERIWLLAKLPGEIRVKRSDDISEKFLLLSNSHDGSAALRVFFTPIRVVCQNTLNLALGKGLRQGISIQHRGDLDSKIVEARELLGFTHRVYKDMEQQAEVLASYYPRAEQLEVYFKALYPDPPTGEANRAISTRRELTRLFEEGWGQDIPQIRHSLWAALNAVTEFVDHHRSSRGANTLDRDSRRLESQWFGSGAKLKAKAWELGLALAS